MELKTLTGEVIDLTTLKNDSIIAVRGVSNPTARMELVDKIKAIVPVNSVVLVFRDETVGIDIVPEETMNKLGWYRRKWKDLIVRFIHRVKKMFPKR
ncbi:MAG TPA: hypothetical protein DCS05_08800 [Nitrospiraceae bacterium]|nr:hypothetical protein [Nitrospiraceae bacterium]